MGLRYERSDGVENEQLFVVGARMSKSVGSVALGRGRPWSQDAKRAAFEAWMLTGSQRKAGELTGIPQQTISEWAMDPQNDELRQQVDRAMVRSLDCTASGLIARAMEVDYDRLENGDPQVLAVRIPPAEGDGPGSLETHEYRKPISGKDAAVIASIYADKKRVFHELLDGGGSVILSLEGLGRDALSRQAQHFAEAYAELARRTTDVTPVPALTTPPARQDHSATRSYRRVKRAVKQKPTAPRPGLAPSPAGIDKGE